MPHIYFSDFFEIAPEHLEEHGAFNVSLVGDLPLFVDPFLLFNSEDARYKNLHGEIIRYMRFLKGATLSENLSDPLIRSLFSFSEVRQNWLGFSKTGNSGHGLGSDFAVALHRGFTTVFRNFGDETVTKSSHLEKLGLLRNGVGRDTISDFTTNLIKSYLIEFTQETCRDTVPARLLRKVSVPKVLFNYETRTWSARSVELPFLNNDYVLLTPKDILTKDESWINRNDLIDSLPDIANALPDDVLRAQVNDYLRRVLPRDQDAPKAEVRDAIAGAIEKYPQVLDYYILDREAHGKEATSVAYERVRRVQELLVQQVATFAKQLLESGGFYLIDASTYEEARRRLLFLKDVIENKGGHRIFYLDGKPLTCEADLQILYRLCWYATPSDISREVNDGRGPADFKASRGAADKTLVEFKLAKNTQLERNLARQAPIYEKASDATHPTLKAILYFSDEQLARVKKILKKLGLENDPHVVLIDADASNKPSGSKA